MNAYNYENVVAFVRRRTATTAIIVNYTSIRDLINHNRLFQIENF